jgi:hypothetical protein
MTLGMQLDEHIKGKPEQVAGAGKALMAFFVKLIFTALIVKPQFSARFVRYFFALKCRFL